MNYLIELKTSITAYKDIKTLITKRVPEISANIKSFSIIKKAIDARNKSDILFVFSINIKTYKRINLNRLKKKKIKITEYKEQTFEKISNPNIKEKNPVIVGLGPAGIFCALRLIEYGIKPIIIERGKPVEERIKDVSSIWDTGKVNKESNVMFGEGGAGTFSDGKLSTQINNPFTTYIKKRLVDFGAPQEILYESKPHVGTDKLIVILKNIRSYLVKNGALIKFSTKLTSLTISDSSVKEITLNDIENISSEALFLAIGHSAHDTYRMLHNKSIEMEAKPFAMGFRIEHPQELINKIQYGEKFMSHPLLGASPYKLTYRTANNRSAFSFCMCPGGEVVCCSNQDNSLVINGMSNYRRDSGYANSAMVVSVAPRDFFKETPLDGLDYITQFEKKAFVLGGKNNYAPAQLVNDFINNQISCQIPKTTYKPGVTSSNLRKIYPDYINNTLIEGFAYFNKRMPGFISDKALLLGVETRTSSPMRIPRNKKYSHININNLFPIGEGAGYAGGIISAALDGIKAADSYLTK